MPTVTQTTTDSVSGQTVVLQSTAPTETDGTLEYSVDLSISGVTQDINIALAVDVSGSASGLSGFDLNGDGIEETVLQAEIAAANHLFQSFLDAGYEANEIEITVVAYNGSASTVGTYNMSQQAAFQAALTGLSTGGQTNFGAALTEVIRAWNATNNDADLLNNVTGADTNHVIFMSDGWANGTTPFASQMATLEGTYNASISGIGVGSGASLADLNLLDNTGGAVQITDLTQLASAIVTPPPPLAELTEIELFIDGVSYGVFTQGDGTLITTPVGFRINQDTLTGFPYVPGGTLLLDVVARFDNGEVLQTQHSLLMPFLVCFAAGTRVRVPGGLARVEDLRPGDRVSRHGGGEAVLRWVSRRHVAAPALAANPRLRPVRIRAGALGPGRPCRDLVVSRHHRLLVDDWFARMLFDAENGALAPAHALVNGHAIVAEPVQGDVTFVHLLFDAHEILDAEGIGAESLRPTARVVAGLAETARAALLALHPGFGLMIAAADDDWSPLAPARPLLSAAEARLLVPFLPDPVLEDEPAEAPAGA